MASRLRGMNVNVLREEVALLPVLIVLIIVGTLVSPAFFTVSNFAGIGEQSSALGVVVVGEALILLIGGMDLSLESTFGLAPMVAAWLIVPISSFGNGTDLNPYLGIVVLLAVRRRGRAGQRAADREGQAQRVHRDPRHDDRAGFGLQNGIVKAQSLFNLLRRFGYLGSASIGQLPVSLIVAAVHLHPDRAVPPLPQDRPRHLRGRRQPGGRPERA